MTYYCDHNICPMETDLPAKTDTVMIDRDVHFEQIAHVLNMDVRQIEELNPQYRRNIVNGTSKLSALRLPSTHITQFIDNQDSIFAYDAQDLLSKREEVKVNDDVPTYTKSSKSKSRRSGRRGRGSKRVTIKNGDTLSDIARRNHTTVAKLKRLNKISGTNIRAGKKIRVK